jgi:tRNA(fMet)-specific endonuclease VapC
VNNKSLIDTDIFIAIENNLILVAGNTRHYQKIQSLGYPLQLDNWRE